MTKNGIIKAILVSGTLIAGGVATILNPSIGLSVLTAIIAQVCHDSTKGVVEGVTLSKEEKVELSQNLAETNSILKEDNKNFNEIYNNMLDNIQDPLLSRLVAKVFNPEDMKKYDGSKLLEVQLKYIEKTVGGASMTNDEKRDCLLKLIDFCKDYNEKVEKSPDRIEQRKSDPDSLLPAERSMGSLIATYYIAQEFKSEFTIDEFKKALLNRGVSDLLDTKQYNEDVLKVVLKDLGIDVKNADKALADKNLKELKDPNEGKVEISKEELQSMVDQIDEVMKDSDKMIEEAEAIILSHEEFEKRKAENGNSIRSEGEVEVVDRNNGKAGDDGSDKKEPEKGESKNKDAVDADFSDYGDYGER